MSSYYTCTCLPGNNKITHTELKIKHYKTILKCLISDDIDPASTFLNISYTLADITQFSCEQIEKLDIIDYFILLFEARINSIGSVIYVQKQNNTRLEINLNKLLNNIIGLKKLFLTENITDLDSIKIKYRLPSVNDILTFTEPIVNDIYQFFIESVNINNTQIPFDKLDSDTRYIILQNLPASVTTTIIKKVTSIVTQFNNSNILTDINHLSDQKITFNFNCNVLVYIIKLLFGSDLLAIYENIFVLAKLCNISPEYIENITPGEYTIFLKKLEELNSKQSKNTTSNGGNYNDNTVFE